MPVYTAGTKITEAKWDRLIGAIPCSYTVFKIGATCYAEASFSGGTDYSGTDASAVIQSALDGLTTGRTWKEGIAFKGNFTINTTLKIPSYTFLDFRQATLTLGADVNMFESSSLTTASNYVTFYGGIFNGNGKSGSLIYGIFYRSIFRDFFAGSFGNTTIHMFESGSENSHETWIINAILADCKSHGIRLASADMKVWQTDIGLTAESTVGVYIENSSVKVEGTQIWGTTTARTIGIMVKPTSGQQVNDVQILNNFIEWLGGEGVILDASGGYASNAITNTQIQNNFLRGNGQKVNNGYAQILLAGSTEGITNTSINMNTLRNASANKPSYNIQETGTNSDNVITNNKLSDAQTSPIGLNSSTHTVKYNVGYVTENSGSATITAGNTSVDVTHGLAVTPDINKVDLTPKTDPGGKRWWVEAHATTPETYFVVKIDSSHTSDITFGWSYD